MFLSLWVFKTENRYSGIPTIRREMYEAGLPAPVFQNRRNEFVVILYNARVAKEPHDGVETNNKDLLFFCSIPRSRKEITEYLGISTVFYAMQHYVQPLLESGELIMTMPNNQEVEIRNLSRTKSKTVGVTFEKRCRTLLSCFYQYIANR